MKTAYLDAFSGLSGDMIVGAILDCGADFPELERAIKSLQIAGYRLSTRRKVSSGISALKFDVEVTEPQPARHFGEIRALIDRSLLGAPIKHRAISIFEVLARAEAKIHDTTPDHVHFHEVGAVDSIIDIVGTAWDLSISASATCSCRRSRWATDSRARNTESFRCRRPRHSSCWQASR